MITYDYSIYLYMRNLKTCWFWPAKTEYDFVSRCSRIVQENRSKTHIEPTNMGDTDQIDRICANSSTRQFHG